MTQSALTSDLWALITMIILGVIHLGIASSLNLAQLGRDYILGPREPWREPSGVAGRVTRAYRNWLESFPQFLASIFVVHAVGAAGILAAIGAWTFVVARIAYLGAYLSNVRGLRPLCWMIGQIGVLIILAQLLIPQPSQKNVEPSQEEQMQKVTGIGGFFYRASDGEALVDWYRNMLGVDFMDPVWIQEKGPTVFAPFDEDSNYFPTDRRYMINFRVEDLDSMIAQLEAKGVTVEQREEWNSEVGKFARISDPEGNPIELWEPQGPAKTN